MFSVSFIDIYLCFAGVVLGTGWYAQKSIHVGPPSLLFSLKLHVQSADGDVSIHNVVSDTTWLQHLGPVVFNDIYDGTA